MPNDNLSQLEQELHEVKGSLDVLVSLREEFEQWLEEANNDSEKEALENVLGHIESMETEYQARAEGLQEKLDAA